MWAAIHRDVRDISFLLDTGASVSILSKEVFDEIPKEDRPHLQQTDKKLSASNGSIIHTHGIATLTIDVQGMPIQEDFWICNCDATGILGIPFMEKANVVLDIGRRRVFIKKPEDPPTRYPRKSTTLQGNMRRHDTRTTWKRSNNPRKSMLQAEK